jgi:hypothetical protein
VKRELKTHLRKTIEKKRSDQSDVCSVRKWISCTESSIDYLAIPNITKLHS